MNAIDSLLKKISDLIDNHLNANNRGQFPATMFEEPLPPRIKNAPDTPPATVEPAPADSRFLSLVNDLIIFRDGLDLLKAEVEENPEAAKIIANLYRQTGRLLQKSKAEPLDGKGMFDSSVHVVADTRETEEPQRDNEIVETTRPGYRLDGTLLRPQEVVILVYRGAAM